MDAHNRSPPAASLFEKLPADIKILIYEIVLVAKNGIDITDHAVAYRNGQVSITKRVLRQPPLCQVNRTMRLETIPIFCGHNTFTINLLRDPSRILSRWLAGIGPQNRMYLRQCWTLWNDDHDNVDDTHYDRTSAGQWYCRAVIHPAARHVEKELKKAGIVSKIGEFKPLQEDDSEQEGDSDGWVYARLVFEDEDEH